MLHHYGGLFIVNSHRAGISQPHQLLCQIGIAPQLFQHKVKLYAILPGALQHFLRILQKGVHINEIGIRFYDSLPVETECQPDQFRIPFYSLFQEHLHHSFY